MKSIWVITLLGALVLLAFVAAGSAEAPLPETENGIAVIELFTSQGCSSCPSADKVLQEINKQAKDSGKKVYALSMHVDYWNYLGWKDPYSSETLTQRQREYGSAFGLRSIYTPQMIINGNVEFVGSRSGQAKAEVEKALSQAPQYNLAITRNSVDNGKINWDAQQKFSGTLNLAVVRVKADNDVPRGENRGRKLSHNNVVMAFSSSSVNSSNGMVNIPEFTELSGESYELVAYLQESGKKVVGAAALPLL
ncbi:MAG: DUF1223 domain-containing protein [Calditrichia bacterium]